MSRDKQTEIKLTESEILANDIAQMCPDLVNGGCGDLSCVTCLAKGLEQIGYRKTADVAEEIFAEIERLIELCAENTPTHIPFNYIDIKFVHYVAELKKEYIGEDTNVTTKESEEAE